MKNSNIRDFTVNDISRVINEISEKFEFNPGQALINFIEIGVNISVNENPSEIIKSMVHYKNIPFTQLPVKDKGFGRICDTQLFIIKIYDKGLQNDLAEYLLRFEIKVKRMKFLKRYGISILTLADLQRNDLYKIFGKILVDVLNGILFFDNRIEHEYFDKRKDRELFLQGKYCDFWQNIPRTTRKRRIEKFRKLANSDKIATDLANQIIKKWNELTTFQTEHQQEKTERNNHFQKVLPNQKTERNNHFHTNQQKPNTERNNLTINSYSVPVCSVTGLQYHGQQSQVDYLTYNSVKWYFENDSKTFENVLESLLTDKWKLKNKNNPKKEWLVEICHKIRCAKSNDRRNPINNTRKSFQNLESKGLKLWSLQETVRPDKLKLINYV